MNALRDRHVQFWLIALLLVIAVAGGVFVGVRAGSDTVVYDYTLALEGGKADAVSLQYGVWPALAHADFFAKVHDRLVAEKAHFVEANLTTMKLSVYRDGARALTVPIKSKGREGSWWETPSGLYKAQGKEENHFSSFGKVYMPYSIPFQGNFFIHGWPYHPDGTPVPEGYSGGCMRLEDVYAKQVYDLVDVGMPILVYEDVKADEAFTYTLDVPALSAGSYLVADLDNNFVLLNNGTDTLHHSAIPAKLMTALVASEYQNIEKQVTVQNTMLVDATSTRFMSGSVYSIYDLLFPLLMQGSTESAQVLAEYFGTSRFVSLMNAKAQAVGMTHTSFAEEADEGASNKTTAEDLFILLKYLRANRSFVLGMTAGTIDTQTYGVPAFADVTSTHPLATLNGFAGGMADIRTESVNIARSVEAAVLLVFATSTQPTLLAGDDLVTVFTIPFGASKRTIAVIALDSQNPVEDTHAMLAYVERMYR